MKAALGQITGLAWSGNRLYETDGFIGMGMLRTWDPVRAAQVHAKELQKIGLRHLALASDEKLALTLGNEGDDGVTLRWVDPATGKQLRRLDHVDDSGLALSGDGKTIAVWGEDKILVLDAVTGSMRTSIQMMKTVMNDALALSPD